MKLRTRKPMPIGPIHVLPGDTISGTYTDGHGTSHLLDGAEIEREMMLDEVAIFDLEPGDIPGAVDGVGGVFIDTGRARPQAEVTDEDVIRLPRTDKDAYQ